MRFTDTLQRSISSVCRLPIYRIIASLFSVSMFPRSFVDTLHLLLEADCGSGTRTVPLPPIRDVATIGAWGQLPPPHQSVVPPIKLLGN